LGGLWALEWTWHDAETNLRCVRSSGICTPNRNSLALIVSEISAFIRTDGQTNMTRSTRLYFIGSGPPACYILSDESSIPFYYNYNFSAIATLSVIPKLLQHLITLPSYTPSQHGFNRHRSTTTNFLEF